MQKVKQTLFRVLLLAEFQKGGAHDSAPIR